MGSLPRESWSVATEAILNAPHAIRNKAHSNCIACGPENRHGLQLEFALAEDGSVQTTFDCDATYQGFPDILHGGMVSMLLDGAMTNCLFAHGHDAVTGELKIRFRHPVLTNRPATVRAWIETSSPPYHLLGAQVMQDGQIKARAEGKFVNRPRHELDKQHPADFRKII